MKSLTLVLFVLCFVFALPSCNTDESCNTVITYPAIDQVKNLTKPIAPLTGTDTLKFLFNGVDTQVYVGQGVQIGSKIRHKAEPGECDEKYEYLIYNYKCINYTSFAFRMDFHPYPYTSNGGYPDRFYFGNVSIGDYMIEPNSGDNVVINGHKYDEPYYRSNGPDTAQYFMLSWQQKNANAYFLKIKYGGVELTLLR